MKLVTLIKHNDYLAVFIGSVVLVKVGNRTEIARLNDLQQAERVAFGETKTYKAA